MRALFPFLIAAATVTLAGEGAGDRFPLDAWNVDEHTRGILVQDHRVPVVYIRLEFPVGSWSAWARDVDLVSAMGIQIHDPEGELRRRSDALAATVSSGAADRHSWLTAWCLKEDLPGLADLIRDVLANERFDGKELRRWKQQARIAWSATETDVEFLGQRLVARALYRTGDPRLRPYEAPRRVSTDSEALRRIRDRVIRLPGRSVGLAGDLTPDEAEKLAASLLPAAVPGPTPETAPALLPLLPRAQRHDDEARVRRLTQVYFGMAREALGLDDPDYPAFVLANHVLGGHFHSRIMVALRHDGGETYGAFAHADVDLDPGPFVIGSFTRTDNAPHAEAKLRETVRLFGEEGITEQERSEVIGHLRGNALFERQAPYQVLGRRMQERRLGLPDGSLDRMPDRAAEFSLAAINEFIRRYYAPETFVLGRVAPAD